jgi:5-oxoprolinase (ATP-hydrolysing) subunit C
MLTARLRIDRAGPLTTIQDRGRPGWLRFGIGASGPMDRGAFARAGQHLGLASRGGIEFTAAGLDVTVLEGSVAVGMDGGSFDSSVDGKAIAWPGVTQLRAGKTLSLKPGSAGNYGYLRFSAELVLPKVLGSLATSSRVGLGGLDGRALRRGDEIELGDAAREDEVGPTGEVGDEPIRVLWGLHADSFAPATRQRFLDSMFVISSQLDRMGVLLGDPCGVFKGAQGLSLVSDAIVVGDIQILGDGTPIALMRDHQPTGGYPRIATIISADLDRFAQLRPGTEIRFAAVTLAKAHAALRARLGA